MANRVEYNAAVIETFATRLYRRAATILVFCIVLGLLIGLLVPLVINRVLLMTEQVAFSDVWIVVGSLIGALLGIGIGTEKGFQLRLQAQQLMCQVSIERNTLMLLRHWQGASPTQPQPHAAGPVESLTHHPEHHR